MTQLDKLHMENLEVIKQTKKNKDKKNALQEISFIHNRGLV